MKILMKRSEKREYRAFKRLLQRAEAEGENASYLEHEYNDSPDNPYPEGSELYLAWDRGYEDHQVTQLNKPRAK